MVIWKISYFSLLVIVRTSGFQTRLPLHFSCVPGGPIAADTWRKHVREVVSGINHGSSFLPIGINTEVSMGRASIRIDATTGAGSQDAGNGVPEAGGLGRFQEAAVDGRDADSSDFDSFDGSFFAHDDPSSTQESIGVEDYLEDLDVLLQRDERRSHSAVTSSTNTDPGEDDGFGELDDLLFDTSSSKSHIADTTSGPPTTKRGSGETPNEINRNIRLEMPIGTDSFDDLLDVEPPTSTEHTAASPESTEGQGQARSGSNPWLDELMTLEEVPESSQITGDSTSTSDESRSPPSAAVDGPSGETLASIDDWLDGLLGEESGSPSRMTTNTPNMVGRPSRKRGHSLGTKDGDFDEWGSWSTSSDDTNPQDEQVDQPGNGSEQESKSLLEWKSQANYAAGHGMKWTDRRQDGAERGVRGTRAEAQSWMGVPGRGRGRGRGWGRGRGTGRSIGNVDGTQWVEGSSGNQRSDSRDGEQEYRGVHENRDARGKRWDNWKQDRRAMDPVEAAQQAVVNDLNSLRKQGRWEDALRALVSAKVRGLTLNILMYNSAMEAVAEWGRWQEARSMMEQMRKDGLEPNVASYTAAITACGKVGEVLRALDLIKEMDKCGIMPDRKCYGAMISACADAGYVEKTRALMRRMSDDDYTPDRDTYNWAIVACGEHGEWETALDLLGEMRRKQLRPDLYSYQMAMKACGSGGMWERATLLLREMEEDGTTPETPAYKSVLETIRDAGQWEQALAMLEEMDEVGVEPDEDCFALAIEVCAEHGQWQEALDVLNSMRLCSQVPDIPIYNLLLKACMKGKAWERSLSLLNDMRRSGRKPDQESWDFAFIACADAGRWECCYGIAEMMISQIVWFDLDMVKDRFDECPDEDISQRALTMIRGHESIEGPSLKRKSKLSKARFEKRQNSTSKPKLEKKAPKKRKQSGRTKDGQGISYAEVGVE